MKYLVWQGTTTYVKCGVGISWNNPHTDIGPTNGDQLYCYTSGFTVK